MRVTTQMLNASAKKTGLPFSYGKSLLDYVNESNTGSGNTLLNALDKSSTGSNTLGSSVGDINTLLNSLNKSSYEKLEKQADQLSQSANVFTVQGEDSVFEKAKESGEKEAIYEGLETLIENYNGTLKELQSTQNPLNQYYGQMLGEAVVENSEALKEIGISVEKDGTLTVDKSKMKAADVESLEKALGTSGTFTKKVAFVASRISGNAQANAQSLSSQYNVAGNIYTAASSKYDFLG